MTPAAADEDAEFAAALQLSLKEAAAAAALRDAREAEAAQVGRAARQTRVFHVLPTGFAAYFGGSQVLILPPPSVTQPADLHLS
jgi:hypothetical protein